MKSLDVLDPTRPDDPAFAASGEQAQRVRENALRRAQPPSPGARRPPRTAGLILVAGLIAAAAGAGLVVTAAPPPDARAALQAAVARTRSAASGRIIRTVESRPPGSREPSTERHVLRFDADGNLEWVERARIRFNGRTIVARRTYREVGRRAWIRDDTAPDARFEPAVVTADRDFPHQLVRHVGSPALVRLVRRAPRLDVRTAPDGSTTYRAGTTAGAVEDAAPNAAGRARGGAWKRTARLTVVVDGRGFVRRVVVSAPGSTMTTQYVGLDRPQHIARP